MDIEARVSRLERINRGLVVGLGLALGCVGLMAAKAPPKVVTAQQFMVRDEAGNAKAVFGTDIPTQARGLTGIYFWRKDGSIGAEIDLNAKDETNFQLIGKGKTCISALIREDTGPFLMIQDEKGDVLAPERTIRPSPGARPTSGRRGAP